MLRMMRIKGSADFVAGGDRRHFLESSSPNRQTGKILMDALGLAQEPFPFLAFDAVT
jgi:hypothetical protein